MGWIQPIVHMCFILFPEIVRQGSYTCSNLFHEDLGKYIIFLWRVNYYYYGMASLIYYCNLVHDFVLFIFRVC
jgi:hypothetical protein